MVNLSGSTIRDRKVMAVKGYFTFPKAPVLLEPHHQIDKCHISGHSFEESYPSAEMHSVNSTAPADWAKEIICHGIC